MSHRSPPRASQSGLVPGFWCETIGYASLTLKDVAVGTEVKLSKVFETKKTDDGYLTHKIGKIRRHPTFLPFTLTFQTREYDPEVPKLRHWFHSPGPYFPLVWRNEAILKILSVKNSVKASPGVILRVTRGEKVLPVFGGRCEAKTHFMKDTGDAKYHDEILLQLPWEPDDNLSLEVDVWNLEATTENRLIGSSVIPFIVDGVALPNPDTHFPLSPDGSILLKWDLRSSIYCTDSKLAGLLRGDFACARTLDYVSLVPKLPPVLDVVLKGIFDGQVEAFEALLSIIDLFPFGQNDPRHNSRTWVPGQRCEPLDHLLFYARSCAFRALSPIATFFDHCISFWISYLKKNAPAADRPDLRSIPFLTEILSKCLVIDSTLVSRPSLRELISLVQNAFIKLVSATDTTNDPRRLVPRLVSRHLCCFYKDLSNFSDKVLVINSLSGHLRLFNTVSSPELRKKLTSDFLMSTLSPIVLILLCAPIEKGSVFSEALLPSLIFGITDLEHTNIVMAVLASVMRCLDGSAVHELVPGLFPLVPAYGSCGADLMGILSGPHVQKSSDLIIPFSVLLAILAGNNLDGLRSEGLALVGTIITIADREAGIASISGEDSLPWQRIAWCADFLAVRLVGIARAFDCYNHIIIPAFRARFSSALLAPLISTTLQFLNKYPDHLYGKRVQTYRFVKFLVAHLTKDSVPLLLSLWELEKRQFKTNARCLAFFLRAVYRRTHKGRRAASADFASAWDYFLLDKAFLALLNGTPFGGPMRDFSTLWNEIGRISRDDVTQHDEIADTMLALADFFRPSPDIRVRVLVQLAGLHGRRWPAEAAIALLRAAALIAEILSVRGAFGGKLTAASFLEACPSALAETTFTPQVRDVLARTPKLPGFCDSKYFCDASLISMVERVVIASTPPHMPQLYELARQALVAVGPVLETHELWPMLARHFRGSAKMVADAVAVGRPPLDTFWFTTLESGQAFVYHENGFMDQVQFAEGITPSVRRLAGNQKIEIVYSGQKLEPSQAKKGVFRVLVKKLTPYFTREERSTRFTPFERGFNVSTFYYDKAESRGKPNAAADHWAVRTIITIPCAMPHITSRVSVPKEGIKCVELMPVEVASFDLLQAIYELNEELDAKNFQALRRTLKGAIMPEVNPGPLSSAETFLNGAVEDDRTAEMRQLFHVLLEVLHRAVEAHGQHLDGWGRLHDMFVDGLQRLTAALQPYLM